MTTATKKINCEECALEMTVTRDFKPKHLAFCSNFCADNYATRREEDKKDLTTHPYRGTNNG